ncbi:26S proteasome non-ATPase regulatory subunit 9 [Dinochytrium kinnereticum]|nr:26S proteasome non-ATPase regulatory subunit 9 [Dinochytrium kinnereticum]
MPTHFDRKFSKLFLASSAVVSGTREIASLRMLRFGLRDALLWLAAAPPEFNPLATEPASLCRMSFIACGREPMDAARGVQDVRTFQLKNINCLTTHPVLGIYRNTMTIEQLEFQRVLAEKERTEGEIRELEAAILSHNVSVDEALVDNDGYPRNDVDVYTIRHLRHELVVKQNDYKDIMRRMEKVVQEVFQRGGKLLVPTPAVPKKAPMPFALVNSVAPGSPAEGAGLQAGDKILRFGSLSSENDGFKSIPQEVREENSQPTARRPCIRATAPARRDHFSSTPAQLRSIL